MYDIIPDIHGQAEKLKTRLASLGYRKTVGSWRHPDRNRTVVFLGDFIDRGPENAAVIDIVRNMVDAGDARAVMGNHELNAIRYHTLVPGQKRRFLRKRSKKNRLQHENFLKEFPHGYSRTRDAIEWMKTLPLFLELDGFRAVHACWDDRHISLIRQSSKNGVLDHDLHIAAANIDHPLYDAVETTAKGPEHPLPKGAGFYDKDGVRREYIRVKWWADNPATWQEIAMSVPKPEQLPAGRPEHGILEHSYSPDAPPVFFGHYWLTGAPSLQAPNALCLDYSAGKGKEPLVSYLHEPGDNALEVNRMSGHPALAN